MIEAAKIDRICVMLYHEQNLTMTGAFDAPYWYELDELTKGKYRELVRRALSDDDFELFRLHRPDKGMVVTLLASDFTEEDVPEGHPDFVKVDVSK